MSNDSVSKRAGSTEKVPRFQAIIEHLRQQIHSGTWPEHTALPPERTLAERFGISRMTARRALLAIETEGLAYSAGRRGRFVSPARLTYDIGNMVSFSAHAQRDDLGLSIKVISSGVIAADTTLASRLPVEMGEEFYKYTRLFLIKDHPTFIEEEFVIARLFPDLLERDLTQSTTLLLERHYDTAAHTGNIVIRMRALREEEAGLLGLATYQAGIELEQLICDKSGQPFCFGRQIWRGELAEFTAQAVVRDKTDIQSK
ncbi:GntR family transcriptional regulator [uncultured Roseovarius sp.]|uniref:GntR family transcriptional regulator n=1 Tax=uncultured Roseovarius sp. TaxID=293344 RepID=UPI00262E9E1D|nr:GntR family transcriptional regulator [uncultured Roseovarius sp.]